MKKIKTYTAAQCTDVHDCEIAITQVKELIRQSKPTKALYKRLLSLEKRKFQLSEKS